MKPDRSVLKDDGWHYFLDGVEVTQEEHQRRYPPPAPSAVARAPGGTPSRGWPMRNRALAVHPDQVEAARDRNRAAGVNVDYDGSGAAIIPDRAAYKSLLRLESEVLGQRIVNRDDYY